MYPFRHACGWSCSSVDGYAWGALDSGVSMRLLLVGRASGAGDSAGPRAPSPRTTAATAVHRALKCSSGFSRYFSSCPGSQPGGLAKRLATVVGLVFITSSSPRDSGDDENKR